VLVSLLLPRIPDATKAVVIPVPLHHTKELRRGFNQADLLAREIAEKLEFTYSNDLVRLVNTRSQVGLSRSNREKNLEGAFKLRNVPEIKGKTVYLIDDVVTSGSTFAACARELKMAGARKVICMAIARNLHLK